MTARAHQADTERNTRSSWRRAGCESRALYQRNTYPTTVLFCWPHVNPSTAVVIEAQCPTSAMCSSWSFRHFLRRFKKLSHSNDDYLDPARVMFDYLGRGTSSLKPAARSYIQHRLIHNVVYFNRSAPSVGCRGACYGGRCNLQRKRMYISVPCFLSTILETQWSREKGVHRRVSSRRAWPSNASALLSVVTSLGSGGAAPRRWPGGGAGRLNL